MSVAQGCLERIFRRRLTVCHGVPGGRAECRGGCVEPASRGDRESSRNEAARPDQAAAPRKKCTKSNRGSTKRARCTAGQQRRDVGRRDRRAGLSATHRSQRHDDQWRGGERATVLPPRRGAGGGAGPDRHPAFRRRQSQPVFSARLQSRSRHRPLHQDRRHARQHADPRPRTGLCRYQFHDSRADPVGECPQGSVLR
jgi:hypothetical protein